MPSVGDACKYGIFVVPKLPVIVTYVLPSNDACNGIINYPTYFFNNAPAAGRTTFPDINKSDTIDYVFVFMYFKYPVFYEYAPLPGSVLPYFEGKYPVDIDNEAVAKPVALVSVGHIIPLIFLYLLVNTLPVKY